MNVTFVTGNPNKAAFLEKYLGHNIGHQKLELDEIQSLDLQEITSHKARQAYQRIKKPVLVEDIAFSLDALGGKLPGPFIKWFLQEVGFEGLCRLTDIDPGRKATIEVCYVYFDGKTTKFFSGKLRGTVPEHPKGVDGFGWNCIFIPEGTNKTNAEMNEEETAKFSLRTTTVYPQIKKFLENLDKK